MIGQLRSGQKRWLIEPLAIRTTRRPDRATALPTPLSTRRKSSVSPVWAQLTDSHSFPRFRKWAMFTVG